MGFGTVLLSYSRVLEAALEGESLCRDVQGMPDCLQSRRGITAQGNRGLLLLQGDRFGGALDAAAKMFSKAFDSGIIPMEFVNKMKKEGKLIMGIGHRVKSVSCSP